MPAKVALEVAESLPEMFRGKGELVQLCQSLSKKWGKSRSTVPLSAFAPAKATLWSSLQRFVPWLERCAFADDFLWELRHERTLKFESRRSKALLTARKKERGTTDAVSYTHLTLPTKA